MPLIQPIPWDSRQLGLPVGRLVDFAVSCNDESLADYGLLLARVPQQNQKVIAKLQTCHFQYIGLDLCLVADPDELELVHDTRWNIRRVSHCPPEFQIRGFRIEDSRFMLDPACRERLPMNFWDRVIHEHCSEFADTVICAIDTNNSLAGIISCLTRPTHVDLFMVAVHPAYQGTGLGAALLRNAAALGRECGLELSTSVMASNVRGLNFYLRHKFLVKDGEVVMHRWQERAQDGR